jgi:DNA adenine methylase
MKRQARITPPSFNRYIEPFLGGGAMFFSLPKCPYIISDINPELINCYQAIKTDYRSIEKHLYLHQKKHCDGYYYRIRESRPECPIAQAARFMYLNRTCWNGLYRVNQKGQFNVPKGSKNDVILSTDKFDQISKRLRGGKIICQDFERTLSVAKEGDFLFIDPPYTVNHNLNGFLKYNEKIFSWDDQERLRIAIDSAVKRGAMITMTNADHESIRQLYEGMCNIETVERSSVIAGSSKFRGKTSEIVMRMGWDNSS